jgi:hypothetical protein
MSATFVRNGVCQAHSVTSAVALEAGASKR